jgi:membrane protein YdbS with pleckstrin-like domain
MSISDNKSASLSIKFSEAKTKECPFCAEVIAAKAVKCRFCNEFLNTSKAAALMAGESSPEAGSEILYEANQSAAGIAGAIIKGTFFFGFGVFLTAYRLEGKLFSDSSGEMSSAFGRYRVLAGLTVAAIALIVLMMKIAQVKNSRYKVTADRIEYETGIFGKKVDNLDMFRIIDIKLRRRFFDYIFGIGTVELATKDESHPKFIFKDVPNARRLYDIIKKASLNADQQQRVVHLE